MRAKTIQTERYIRDAAVKRGINPDVAVKVAKSEGLGAKSWQSTYGPKGRKEKSYGPFQLNIEKNRLGVQFMKDTGLDPRDPATVEAQIDYALDHAAKHGWGAWYGAARVGVAKRQGLAKARPVGVQTQVAQAAPQAVPEAPMGGLASFFSDPLGMSAQAAEAPQGLAAFAAPDIGPTGYDPARNPAKARAEAMFAATPKGLAQPSFDARFGAQPTQSQFNARMGTPQVSVSGPVSPEHYTSATGPRAAFDAASIGMAPAGIGARPAPSNLGPDPGGLGSLAGSMVGPGQPNQGRMGAITGKPDPFGNEQVGGPLATVQKAEVARAPGAELAYAPEQTAPQGLGAIEQAAPTPKGLGSLLSPNMMAPGMMANSALALSPENYNALQPPADPQVAEIAGNTIPDPNESYPAAPTPENTFPAAPDEPSMFGPKTKAALGALLGGPIGAALGLASGALSGGLGGPAGRPSDAEGYNAGYGLGAMQQGINGPRGAIGYSLSNPGTFSQSRGFGLGSDLTNQFGARTTYGPSGDIRANKDTNWGGVLGSLFGGESKKSDKDKAGKGKGLGGKYSGAGLY